MIRAIDVEFNFEINTMFDISCEEQTDKCFFYVHC